MQLNHNEWVEGSSPSAATSFNGRDLDSTGRLRLHLHAEAISFLKTDEKTNDADEMRMAA